jgi:hypothetical protein
MEDRKKQEQINISDFLNLLFLLTKNTRLKIYKIFSNVHIFIYLFQLNYEQNKDKYTEYAQKKTIMDANM